MNIDDGSPPEDRLARTQFMVNRAQILHKLLSDRRIWFHSRTQLVAKGVLNVSWIDHDGQEQITFLTPGFQAGHTTVIRAVACDLINCGPEGQVLAQRLMATHDGPTVIFGDQSPEGFT